MDAKGSDDASRGFARVFFGPPHSEISAHSSALDSTTADSGAQVDDPEVSFTWKVPLTSLQLGGFKCAVKASDPDYPPSVPGCPQLYTSLQEPRSSLGKAFVLSRVA